MDEQAELRFLLSDAKKRLGIFLRDIRRVKKHIDPATYEQSSTQATRYIYELNTLQMDKAYEYLRTHQVLFGALITGTDWQSPSFTHSLHSQAGRQTGTIYATINDYKRDQHWDAHRYEEAFRKEYVDSAIKFPIHVDATSSGMAAFTTILGFLVGEKKTNRGVLMGSSTYFENKELIEKFFPDHFTVVDESKTNDIFKKIDTLQPSVIFFDSLANAQNITVPDLIKIITYLLQVKDETYLVIDNTGLSIAFQPFARVVWKRTNLRLILFESLNKYHQFGMDRVTGGIIVSYGKDTQKLFDYRVHMGTNIPDATAASLPTPNRKFLTSRIIRHQRNATRIVEVLRNWIKNNPGSPFANVNFPGRGSYFVIEFKKRYTNIRSYKKFVNLCMRIAKKRRADLINGSSFGLNTTRIYLTAVRSKPTIPFIRIAVGTENALEMDSIIAMFIAAFQHFR